MPSRPLLSPPSPPQPVHKHNSHSTLLLILTVTVPSLLILIVLVLIVYLYFRLKRRRAPTLPLEPPPHRLRRFSYRELHAASAGFDSTRAIGRGASAGVFRGVLADGKSVAVKQLAVDPASPSPPAGAAELEFQNELLVLGALPPSPHIVSLLGYCLEGRQSRRRRRRRLLVYEYVPGGSLQEALFGSGGEPAEQTAVLSWERRFQIVLDVAAALEFLHLSCDPPIVHGDIKPSNVLLTSDYRAKVCDFGLARTKDDCDIAGPTELLSQELGPSQELFDPTSPQLEFNQALQTCASHRINRTNPSLISEDNKGKEVDEEYSKTASPSGIDGDLNGVWGKDWWWKQDGSGELCSKDYVREWLGTQICPSDNPDWIDETKSSPLSIPIANSGDLDTACYKEIALEEACVDSRKKCSTAIDKKGKQAKEWWKEEYFAEISQKQMAKKRSNRWFRTNSCNAEASSTSSNYAIDISFRKGWKKGRTQSVGSDMWSGDLFSRELSSTMSMRGTMCYIAPEYGGCGHSMEKADIYSFGVLVLVIVSGRRPLHVLSSPIRLDKANLVSWSRKLAQKGNVLELVDERLKDCYNKEQASLCINLALLCLQKTPELRPDSGDVVKILKGEMEMPVVPIEYSPSPRSKLFSRSRRKAALDAE